METINKKKKNKRGREGKEEHKKSGEFVCWEKSLKNKNNQGVAKGVG